MKKLFLLLLLFTVNINATITTPFGINCGDGDFIDDQSFTWHSQTGYMSISNSQYVEQTVIGSVNQDLYKWENFNYGSIVYAISINSGNYKISLDFVEFFQPRTMFVQFEGTPIATCVIPHDNTLYRFSYNNVAVTDGTLDIVFTSDTGIPIINAILIENMPTPTATITATIGSQTPTPCINSNISDEYICIACGPNLDSIGHSGPAIITGTPSFYTSPAPPNSGIYSIGDFSTLNYAKFSSAQNTSISNTRSGIIDFYWYITSFDNLQCPLSWDDAYWGGRMLFLTSGNAFYLNYPSGAGLLLASGLTTNAWHEFTFAWSIDGHVYFWLDGNLTYAGYGLNNNGTFFSTITNLTLGVDGVDGTIQYPVTGYMTQFKFSNTTVTAPPYVDGCNITPGMTITPYATYMSTPTPARTLSTQCSAPWPGVFIPCSSPILTPITSPETVTESDMILGNDNKFHLISSREIQGPPINYYIELSTADTLNPITGGNFVDKGILIGNGVCGIDNALMAKQVHMNNGIDRLYYRNKINLNIDRIDSTDGGYHYITASAATAIDITTLNQYNLYSTPGEFASFDAVTVIPDPAGTSLDYYCLAELNLSSAFGLLCQYPMWLFYSIDGGNTFTPASPVPLYSMAAPSLGSIYAHPRSLTYTSATGLYGVFQGVGFAGPIVHVKSYDLYNWMPDTSATLSVGGLPQSAWDPIGWNQIGDTGGMVSYKGKTYLPFSEEMQTGSNGVIGLAVFSGSMTDYDNCIQTTPTPTPSFLKKYLMDPLFY